MKINYTNSISPKNNLLIICNEQSKLKNTGLSDSEIKLINKDFSNKLSNTSIQNNQRKIFIYKKENGKTYQHENMRKLAYGANKDLNKLKLSTIDVVFDIESNSEKLAFVDAFLLSNYQFLKYFSDKKDKLNSLQEITLNNKQVVKSEIEALNQLTSAVYTSRDLVNEPLSYLTATQLSKEIAGIAKKAGFKFEFFDKKKIVALKMGGYLSVNKGSIDPPTFNILEYKSAKAKNKKPIVLVRERSCL